MQLPLPLKAPFCNTFIPTRTQHTEGTSPLTMRCASPSTMAYLVSAWRAHLARLSGPLTWLADESRVVLVAWGQHAARSGPGSAHRVQRGSGRFTAREHADHARNLLVASDHRVELPVHRLREQQRQTVVMPGSGRGEVAGQYRESGKEGKGREGRGGPAGRGKGRRESGDRSEGINEKD
eukprot:3675519-Rhodomonas_salina.1